MSKDPEITTRARGRRLTSRATQEPLWVFTLGVGGLWEELGVQSGSPAPASGLEVWGAALPEGSMLKVPDLPKIIRPRGADGEDGKKWTETRSKKTHGKEESRKESARRCAPKSFGMNEKRKTCY